MSQQIQEISIRDLVLWTENPRDVIDINATDQDIANKAWKDDHEKWNLLKLVKEMASHYDFSELPTVVYHNDKPIVYDGNRRMLLAKLKYDYVILDGFDKTKLPSIPSKIPCNVCSKEIAIQNVLRKHGESGSWTPLDRDLFIHKFMNEPKSTFLKFDEATGLISENKHLNQVFVKNEILTVEKLKEMGFEFDKDELKTKHSDDEAISILNDLSEKIQRKTISTRNNRGNVLEVLERENRQLISNNSAKPLLHSTFRSLSTNSNPAKASFPETTAAAAESAEAEAPENPASAKRQASRTKKKDPELFYGLLYLKPGQASDLYRDIYDLYKHYIKYKTDFSQYFPSLIRMSLRLLAEAAASDHQLSMKNYLKNNFKKAKESLDADSKTTLSTQNVTEDTIEQLLHIGAHNYSAANNLEQTLAVSLILGKILEISHGK